MFFRLLYLILFLPFKLLFPTKVKGKENLIKGKAILCCNHHSNFDFFHIFASCKTKVYTLCKKELYSSKFKAWFFKKLRTIPVDRQKPEVSSIKKCLEVLNNNNNLLVFPEGTRTSNEDVQNIKNGVAMFALKTKSPIIPMVYLKKARIFRKNTLVIGKPIYFDLEYNKENIVKVNKIVEDKMNELLVQNKGEK